MHLPRPASAPELAVLRHPDRRSSWAIGLKLFAADVGRVGPSGVARLVEAAPIVAARWRGGRWRHGAPPHLTNLPLPLMLGRFDLAAEAPLRVSVEPDGGILNLVGHHAALDGLGLVAVARGLLGLPPHNSAAPTGDDGATDATAAAGRAPWRRLLHPADRVEPSARGLGGDSLAARLVDVKGKAFTAQLATAASDAIAASKTNKDARLRRVGISVAVGGEDRVGNTASYRRVDLDLAADGTSVASAVQAALRAAEVPHELRHPSPMLRLLAPVVDRLSDTFLVSNLGRLELPGVDRVEFYPVARGRSAVAFGAAGIAGGPTTLTIRARDLNQADAEALLDAVVARLADESPP